MELRETDLRISYFQTGIARWTGNGTVTHLPTGISLDFKIAWNDRSGLNEAKAEIARRIADYQPD